MSSAPLQAALVGIVRPHSTMGQAVVLDNAGQTTFGVNDTLEETGTEQESTSSSWWLNSGAILKVEDGVGKTIQGSLGTYDHWRFLYSSSNPIDTDNGFHPQSIFRLLSRTTWQDFNQEAYFNVVKDNVSDSPNRNESNGLFLLSRYLDHDNFYYVGLRVDGAVVIKKKYQGVYYEMAYKQLLPGPAYDHQENPSLIPKNQWLGIKSTIKNNLDGSVAVTMYTDLDHSGIWTQVAEATDNGSKTYGGPPITNAGHVGIRTDFMDVLFDNYKIN